MVFAVTADPERFDEAADWFLKRVVLTAEDAEKLGTDAGRRAFWVGLDLQLDQVQSVFTKISKAIESGEPFEEWRKKVRTELTNDAHAETVFRNAVQRSYNAGRYDQMRAVQKWRPHWQFDAVLDSRVTEVCRVCNGTILSADHQWWQSHWPPQHHRCFPPGTSVLTAAGPRPIESIQVGDRVLTHRGRFMRVTATMRSPSPDRLVELRLASGRHLAATAGHPALTQRGWTPVELIHPGDRLIHAAQLADSHLRIRNAKRDQSSGVNLTGALRVEASVPHHLNPDAVVGQDEIDEDHSLADDERNVERVGKAPRVQPGHEEGFHASGRHPGLRVSHRVQQEARIARCSGPGSDIGPQEAAALGELVGYRSQSGMGFLGLPIGPVQAFGGALRGHGSHDRSASLAAGRVADVLVRDSGAPAAHRDAILLEQGAQSRQGVAPERCQCLSNREALVDVEGAKDFAESVSVLLQEPILECHLEVVAGHTYLDATDAYVFNIEVESDESYVANGFVVHNCRSSVRSLTLRDSARRGGAVNVPPAIGAAEGFGLAPDKAPVWKPDLKKVDPALAKEAKKKETKPRKPPAKPKTAPKEHDPKHWEERYRKGEGVNAKDYGEAAPALGWGRAMLERGLDRSGLDVHAELERLQKAGHPALKSVGLDVLKQVGNRPLRKQAFAQTPQWKALLALQEHTRTITTAEFPVIGRLEAVKGAKAWFEFMLDKSVKRPSDWVPNHVPEARAFATERGAYKYGQQWPARSIVLGKADDIHTAVHEYGHAIEYTDSRALARSVAFLRARTKGEAIKKLADIYPDRGFEYWEEAWEDKFDAAINAYVGKDYGDFATEITSMGFERLSWPGPWQFERFADKDPDFLYFLLGQLAGR